MIHLAGALLVSTGVAGAQGWPKLKSSVRQLKPVRFFFGSEDAPDAGGENFAPEASAEVLAADAAEKPCSIATEVPADNKEKYRFALSTGTVGIAAGAQFGIIWLTPVSLLLTGYLSARILRSALTVILQEKRIGVDILDSVVITLCLVFNKIGPAAFMIWVLDLADMLLERTSRKSEEYLSEIFGEQVRTAWLLVDGEEIEVGLDQLKKGDIIAVNTGEQVPVDGLVTEGEAMIDQQSLTGEATPVEKRANDEVFAMTVLVAGKIQVKVSKTGQDTLASKIIQVINDASEHKVEMQSVGEKIADKMVLPTLGLGAAGYACAGSGAMLAIINADFGTGIRVAAPIALIASLGTAAKNGVLIKDSGSLELLREIDVVLFDKTGTLTYDIPVVSKIFSADDTWPEEKILLYTAAAEQKFSHPVARAILQKAAEHNMTLPPHDASKYYVGLGIEVTVHGDMVRVGSARYMENEQIVIPGNIREALNETGAHGHTAILAAINGKIAGMLELQSTLRDEAAQVISLLRKRGIKEIILISGDHEAPTRDLAGKIGADRYFAGVLPHQKSDYVQLLQDEGKKVMMVGDGINDSAALSHADIGVSLQGASTIAVDVADIIFMDGTLKKFDYLFTVSDVLHQNVKRSFYLIAVPNTLCIAGAMMGFFGLASSLVLNNGFNLLAAANGALPYVEADKAGKSKAKNLLERIDQLL